MSENICKMRIGKKSCIKIACLFSLALSINQLSFSQVGGPTGSGSWSPVIQMPIVPVAAANLPNGKILTWSAYDRFRFGGNRGRTYTAIFDPTTNSSQELLISNTRHDMFCPGTSSLADGRIVVTGGSSSNRTSIYDPFAEQWSSGPDMKITRGYHSMVTMGDGSIFTIGGSWSGGRGNKHGEIFRNGAWSLLSGLPVSIILDGATSPGGDYINDNHAWLWPAPNGKIFHAGPSINMHWIDLQGNGSFSNAGARGNDDFAYSGITVMYDVGKILKAGGANRHDSGTTTGTGNSYIIDINQDNVQVEQVQSLQFPRTKHNAVVLPNGEVLVIGGITRDIVFNDTGSRLIPELWNPVTKQWRNLAPMQVPRNYHSVAILLPDGRVLAGGGGLCGGCTANHPDVEIFSPSYLFDSNGNLATRPAITNAPTKAFTETTEIITSSSAVSYFSLVRYNNVTHSTNNEQRRFSLETRSLGNNQYEIDIPNIHIAIPGYYMLFAMDANGTPSVAHVIQIKEYKAPLPGPAGVSDELKLWLRADEGISSANTVNQWEDASANEMDANQATGNRQPSIQATGMNFNPSLSFDGVNDHLQTQLDINHAALPNTSILAIYKANNANSGAVWGEDNYGWDRFLVDDTRNRATINQMVSDGQGGNYDIPGLFPVNEVVLANVIYKQGETNASSVHVNGEQVRTFTANQSGSSNRFQIGDDGNPVQPFNGSIAEVIVFGREISPVEREKVHSYLGLKYGLTIDHNYYASDYAASGSGTEASPIWDKALNSAYHHQVKGIGRDDQSRLYQRQAKSEDSEGLLEIYLGAIHNSFPSSNVDNPNSFPDDKSFLIMGHNDATVNTLNKAILGGSKQAISRVWKVAEVGNVGNISLRINKSSLPIGVNYLYVNNTDPNFPNTTATQKIELEDDGGNYLLATHDFTDGDYLGLGEGDPALSFSIKAFLEGPFDNNMAAMEDHYRTENILGFTDPYSLGNTIDVNLLGEQGLNSVLDWVKVELRDANDPSQVISQTAALLKRNGEIMDTRANSKLRFTGLSSSNYFISIRHYNHLG
ncbi:MAG: galactose oxidase-like domain-containing protein, partial [Bacteroidota bacterium]